GSIVNNSWIVRSPSTSSAIRLLAIPYAGGGMAAFRGWAGALAGTADLLVLQLPGRGSRLRERPCTSIAEAAERAASELLADDSRPVAIFGHSLGALIGFEVARQLSARGRAPVTLL